MVAREGGREGVSDKRSPSLNALQKGALGVFQRASAFNCLIGTTLSWVGPPQVDVKFNSTDIYRC